MAWVTDRDLAIPCCEPRSADQYGLAGKLDDRRIWRVYNTPILNF